MQDYILQFLRSPTWRAHTIHSAEEAYIDLLACPEDQRPKNIAAFSKRWNTSRNTTKKLHRELKALGVDPFNFRPLPDVQTLPPNSQNLTTNGQTLTTNNQTLTTPPSRDIQDNNISNILPPPKTVCTSVREEDIPRAEDVQAYINQIGGALFTGQAFIDYHTAKCLWNQHNIRPRVWQAMVRTWRERDKQRTINSPSTPHNNAQSPAPNFHPSTREAERQQRDREFAQHIMQQLATPEQPDNLPF